MIGALWLSLWASLAACVPPPASTSPTPVITASATPSPTATPTPSPTPSPTPATAPPSATVSASPTPSPTPTPTTVGRAPYCTVADVLTPERDYARHEATVLDWTHTLDRPYAPPDLISALDGFPVPTPRRIPDPGPGAADLLLVRGQPGYEALLADDARAQVRKVAYTDLAALRDAAGSAGHRLVIVSAYRSFAQQEATFAYWVSVAGYEQALRTSARPGHSEHQLGTTLDFGDGSAAPWEYADWATTTTGAWLAQHAREFGFVMTYPSGSSAVTCYDYEPWHYRWVGRDLAMRVTTSGRTLREFQTGIR